LNFKAWVVPYIVLTAASVAVIGILVGQIFGQAWFAAVALAIAAFGLFSNLEVGLFQQRDLLTTLGRILDAHGVRA
jgi:hypothetical protein